MNLRNLYEGSNETMDCSVNCDPTCPYDCYSDPYDIPLPPPPLPPTTTQTQSHHLSPFIVILSTSLASFFILVLSYFIIRRCCSRRQGSGNQAAGETQTQDEDHFLDENRGPAIDHHIWYINTVGLQPSIINSISVFRYKKGGNLIEGSDCSVCLSEFQEDDTLRLLPKCNHAFHTHCIDTWLRSHTNCPLCRARIVTNSTEEEKNQEEGLTQMGNSGENGENRGGEAIDQGGRNEFDQSHDLDEVRDWGFIRRSVSMDFGHSSVPKSSQGNRNENQEGASSRNQRSFSCSGRVILTRCNRDPNSVLPL